MRVLRKAIEQFDFDSVLLPVHMASMIDPSPETDFRPVLKLAAERDMSVTAIKAIARGRWKKGTRKKYETWYQPIDAEDDIHQAVSFTLSQKPVATYSLPCDTRLWPMVLEAGLHYKKLNMNQQKKIIAEAREADFRPLFPHQGEYSRE